MDFQSAQDYLQGFTDYEKLPSVVYSAENYDLRRMQELLKALGDPHLKPRTVHITGTKGKGSTAAMVASVLIASGYRTGLYTSPHLHSIRERIRIDGHAIPEAEFASGVQRLKPIVGTLTASSRWRHGAFTTFELLTALAFDHFAGKGVEYQVIEVGLGGRLDATNVVQPQVAAITSISMDHQDILGGSLEKIAREKSGIIKPGVTVVCAPQGPEADQVIGLACRQSGAKRIRVGKDITWRQESFDGHGQSFVVADEESNYELFIPLLGDFQLENAATAVTVLRVLARQGAAVTKESLYQGLAAVSWPGRLQVLGRGPWVVVDGAHNPYSVQKLREAVAKYFDYERLIVILGTSVDKNIAGIIKELLPLSPLAIVTASQHPRATPPVRLAEELARWGRSGEIAPGVGAALERARRLATASDLILVTGSLFVVAEAIREIGSDTFRP
ncbi:MAG: bifunctional folylpolyglutamate synthase/dihydrofolate synthase [Chloroflexi bacterium]|nr:bifunctional folylpolyglutamate synthase/dihydrofolate synthase [Chloroflexota bacterium]